MAISTLYRYMTSEIHVSRKALTCWSQFWNTLNDKYQRQQFFTKYFHTACHKIWIDEFNINLQINRNYWRAAFGERAVTLLPAGPGPNATVIMELLIMRV